VHYERYCAGCSSFLYRSPDRNNHRYASIPKNDSPFYVQVACWENSRWLLGLGIDDEVWTFIMSGLCSTQIFDSDWTLTHFWGPRLNSDSTQHLFFPSRLNSDSTQHVFFPSRLNPDSTHLNQSRVRFDSRLMSRAQIWRRRMRVHPHFWNAEFGFGVRLGYVMTWIHVITLGCARLRFLTPTQLWLISEGLDSTLTRLNMYFSKPTQLWLDSTFIFSKPTQLWLDSFESESSQIWLTTHESSTTLIITHHLDRYDRGTAQYSRREVVTTVGSTVTIWPDMDNCHAITRRRSSVWAMYRIIPVTDNTKATKDDTSCPMSYHHRARTWKYIWREKINWLE